MPASVASRAISLLSAFNCCFDWSQRECWYVFVYEFSRSNRSSTHCVNGLPATERVDFKADMESIDGILYL
jgi:hypothetical protein